MEWYYADESDQQISFQEENFKGLVEAGAIKPDTLVWNSTMTDWKKASEVQPMLFSPAALAAATPAAPPANLPPAYGGNPYNQPADGLGIASMVCGILAILMGCIYGASIIPGIAAIITGHMSKKRMIEQGASGASGMGLAGLIMGYIGTALGVLFIIGIVVAIAAGALSETQ